MVCDFAVQAGSQDPSEHVFFKHYSRCIGVKYTL